MPRAMFIGVGDASRERLVTAMFAPGLGDRFQLNVGRLSTQIAVMVLDRLELDERQAERPRFAESKKLFVR